MGVLSTLGAAPHRPFFLAAGLAAVASMGLWLIAWQGGLALAASWHGHEMIFGFAAAALAGFLLTAVPTWTEGSPLRGPPLMALLLVWAAGRIAMLTEGVAWLDLAFLPLLTVVIAVPILGARSSRNYGVPLLLALLAACNVGYHLGWESRALWLATLLLTALIALIGGRITPLFTQNALRREVDAHISCRPPGAIDRLAVPMVLAAVATEAALPQSSWSGAVALAAAAVLAVRMYGWQTARTVRFPILWVLHAGYAWVAAGYALIGAALLAGWPAPTAALHALTAGAIGVMVLAVMSRAALGHGGRPLVAPPLTVIAYALVNAGAGLRVVLTSAEGLLLAGLVWTAGYALFVIDFWPVLTRPRPDGRPG